MYAISDIKKGMDRFWAVCLPEDETMPQFEYATGQRGNLEYSLTGVYSSNKLFN